MCIACLLITRLSLVPPQLLVVSTVMYQLCDIAILVIAIKVADRTALHNGVRAAVHDSMIR